MNFCGPQWFPATVVIYIGSQIKKPSSAPYSVRKQLYRPIPITVTIFQPLIDALIVVDPAAVDIDL